MRHLPSPFYRQGNWGTEKLRNILRVTDLISSGSECCTQAAWLENLHFEIRNVSMGLSYVWNNFLYRAIYSNFGWMSWTHSPDVLLGFHSSLKRWYVFFSQGFLRAVSKFIKIVTIKIFTSFILTLLHCWSSHISDWFLLPCLSEAPLLPSVSPCAEIKTWGSPK